MSKNKMTSSELIALDRQHIWHPFTQMKTTPEPIVIDSAKGCLLKDTDGNKYIDAISSWWVNMHGHAHPYIAQKLHEQALRLEHVIFAGFTHKPAIELSQRILAKLPNNQAKVFFSDNGSTAVEVGLKMAIQFHYNQGRKTNTIVALEGAYHGDTFGAMAAGDDSPFFDPFREYLFRVKRIPIPKYAGDKRPLKALEEIQATHQVAAFIFEPLIQGAGGMNMYDSASLSELIAYCKEQNIVSIADEVMAGFYRTGKMFASHYLSSMPDIFCLSKGLTGGTLPMSLTTCSQAIYEAFYADDKYKTFFHGHSFTANPLGCAVALASLDLMEADGFEDKIAWIATQHSRFIAKIQHFSILKNIRQLGTILAMDFDAGTTSYFNSLRDELYQFFLDRGVLLRPLGNVVYIMPPYCISEYELTIVYNSILEAARFFDEKYQ